MSSVPDIKMLRDKKQFECVPVNYVRGANWNDTIVIIDEAQNFTRSRLITVLTRIGGRFQGNYLWNIMQSDIKKAVFLKFFNAFNDIESQEQGVYCT